MTAQLENNCIIFGKHWAKNQGWVALADVEKKGAYYNATNYQFLASKPLNEEEATKNHKRKHCLHICQIPKDYTGLIVSESSRYGERKCEKWFWQSINGKIIKNGESIEILIQKNNTP